MKNKVLWGDTGRGGTSHLYRDISLKKMSTSSWHSGKSQWDSVLAISLDISVWTKVEDWQTNSTFV